MTKTYIAGIIDFSERPMVSSDPKKSISDFKIHSDIFQREIGFGLSLLLSSSNPQHKLYLRKPLCIELFEYAHYLRWLKKEINKVCKKVNQLFEKQERSSPLTPLDRNLDRTLNDKIKYLRDPRNKFAAHRYTTGSKEFLTMADMVSIVNKISDVKLIEIKDQLFACSGEMLLWFEKNKNYLVLAGKG